jgi:hypothetical protein
VFWIIHLQVYTFSDDSAQLLSFGMFSIKTRPPVSSLHFDAPTSYGHDMDMDQDDLGEGPSTSGPRSVVSPGENITSAKEYMR